VLNLNPRGWKYIEGYEGLYQVHRHGYVRNSWGLVLKTYVQNSGYESVKLSKNGTKEAWLIHRLVAAAFVPNLVGLPIINHKDGNKRNNFYKNLEWCDNSHNISHARKTGLNPYNKPGLGQKFGVTSKYYGVGFDIARGKWYSSVTHAGKCWHRKRFETEIEAARHYNWILKTLNLTDRPKNEIE
jgi:hypothetical protein